MCHGLLIVLDVVEKINAGAVKLISRFLFDESSGFGRDVDLYALPSKVLLK